MSWATVNIISSATVREKANIAKGVEDRKIDVAIPDAQLALQQILGETLYALIETADPVADATLGGDAGLRTLYNNHAVWFLAFKTKEFGLAEMWAEPGRRGVHEVNGEGFSTIDGKMFSSVQSVPRSRANNRAEEMIRYIKNLDADNAIRVAYETCVKDEPRTEKINSPSRISTRISPWQFPEGNYNRRRDGC